MAAVVAATVVVPVIVAASVVAASMVSPVVDGLDLFERGGGAGTPFVSTGGAIGAAGCGVGAASDDVGGAGGTVGAELRGASTVIGWSRLSS